MQQLCLVRHSFLHQATLFPLMLSSSWYLSRAIVMKMCTVIVLKITISYDDKGLEGIVTATRKCMIQTKLHAGNQWIFLCLIQGHEGSERI
jgi:hypothetical protein